MKNLFATAGLAGGYADSRPPLHPLIVEKIRRRLPSGKVYRYALDVGCGAGLSTAPLDRIARRVIGLEPAESMLRATSTIAPNAAFVAACAERLPFRNASIDVIAAAGSLNYVDLERFFAEARRVLTPGGALVVYDFSQGRRFRASEELSRWFVEFIARYPRARDGAQSLDAAILAELAGGFAPAWQEEFEIGLPMTAEFYERYAMTETNVAFAIQHGAPEAGIREWCRQTLAPVFGEGGKEVLFEGYIACFQLIT